MQFAIKTELATTIMNHNDRTKIYPRIQGRRGHESRFIVNPYVYKIKASTDIYWKT